jgi:regulator of sigma E protease
MLQSLLSWLASALTTGLDLALVIIGFSLIIVVHELGHFLAARWAGIRVLAFAVGFGPALLSWRKGLGLRRGSSEPEYLALVKREREGLNPADPGHVSPTEYRLNVLPFGGYVKMLGQDDVNPDARSDEPDSFARKPVWKRMVVISAGVAANFATAALLFILVFMLGLKTEPPRVGATAPGSPAATTAAINAAELGITEPGLRQGDQILTINGRKPNSFNDLVIAAAMTRRGSPVRLEVGREGLGAPLVFEVVPREDPLSRLLQLGIAPASSARVYPLERFESEEGAARILAAAGLPGVRPGMTLESIDGRAGVRSIYDLEQAVRRSGGRPITALLRDHAGEVSVVVQARRELQTVTFAAEKDVFREARHLVGFMPVMRVEEAGKPAEKAGLRAGDVFLQLGAVEWPSIPEGVAEIRSHRGKQVRVVVVRRAGNGAWSDVDLGEVPVSAKGQIGFTAGDTARVDTRVTVWPSLRVVADAVSPASSHDRSGAELRLLRGSRILRVNDEPVTDFDQLAGALERAGDADVHLTVELPIASAGGAPRIETVTWRVPPSAAAALRSLGWASPVNPSVFEPEEFVLRASGPAEALVMGLKETHRVMLTTYLTFARLFQGSVKVEHLKGPVGIAHIGTIIAGRGIVWLLFFMALISINLAVVNFLPIPIADGGHFVFLCYEQVTGRPISPAVQNAATLVGLALIAGLFLLVTYNDIANLLRG